MSDDEEEEIESCKVVIVGESGVGKTSIISQFINETFQINTESTSGATFSSKTVLCSNNNKLKLEIWDTAGQERFRALTKMFYKDAGAAIVVYDITQKKSFEEIQKYWVEQIKTFNDKIILVIVANKSDLIEKEGIKEDVVRKYANDINASFIVCSALNRNGIDEIFLTIGNKYFKLDADDNKNNNNNNNKENNDNKDNKDNNVSDKHKNNNIKLNIEDVKKQNEEKKKKKGCC